MIDVCYAIADEKGTYSKFLGTSLWSLCQQHAAKDLHIHILHDGTLREKEKQRFRQAAMHFGQQLSFYNVEVLAAAELDYLRQELPQAGSSRYTYAAFYRLLAARLLPQEVTRFIYFDADTVIHMDIAGLWQESLEEYPLAAVAEYDEAGDPADNPMVAAGWLDGRDYFNSGVLLVDREKFLAQGDILRAGIKRLKQLEGFVFYDQDILNAYFANGYKHLNIAYNAFVPALQFRKIQQLVPAVYHYDAGSLGLREDDVYDRLFYTVFSQTPWCDEDFLYRCFAQMERQHDIDLELARQAFSVASQRQRIFCANEASQKAIQELFNLGGKDRYLTMRSDMDWAGRLSQYERVSPAGRRLYILFTGQYEKIKQELLAAGWQEGQDFMDGWLLLPEKYSGHLFRSPALIRNL